MCLKICKPFLAHVCFTPELAWIAAIKMTIVQLELLTGTNIELMVVKQIGVRIFHSAVTYVNTNNK